ncbi:hypothetical protein MMC14_004138 [Varicellaria rhodocarpa]|nr:hypothetical protein [Varicellaria rhodocarpa]
MAQAVAVLHWKAGLDANDVEFVLGSSPLSKIPPTSADMEHLDKDGLRHLSQKLDFHHRSVGMWLLDFDQCQKFEENEQGVERLKKGFYHNDSYYPRPALGTAGDTTLWLVFRAAYLQASTEITKSHMPMAFIEAVKKEGGRRQVGNSMFQ